MPVVTKDVRDAAWVATFKAHADLRDAKLKAWDLFALVQGQISRFENEFVKLHEFAKTCDATIAEGATSTAPVGAIEPVDQNNKD